MICVGGVCVQRKKYLSYSYSILMVFKYASVVVEALTGLFKRKSGYAQSQASSKSHGEFFKVFSKFLLKEYPWQTEQVAG